MAARRLQTDLMRLQRDPPIGVSVELSSESLFEWNAMICGPGDTPFEGGTFRLKLEFPKDFPNRPPTVWFYSRMFHPNVYPNGRICLDILEKPEKWNPVYDGGAVLCAIQSMLGDPNPESPANGEANELFLGNQKAYEERVRLIVAMSDNDDAEGNLNAVDVEDEVQHRLEQLDLSQFEGDKELLREFLLEKP